MTDPSIDADLLARLERFYDAVPRVGSRTEDVGPFTLFISGGEWPLYGRPRLGFDGEIVPADVAAMRERQRQLRVPETFEWVVETTPSLAPALRSDGLAVQEIPLLALREHQPARPPAGHRLRRIEADEPDLDRVQAVAAIAFANGGTTIGDPGAVERDKRAIAASNDHTRLRRRLADGVTVMYVIENDEGPSRIRRAPIGRRHRGDRGRRDATCGPPAWSRGSGDQRLDRRCPRGRERNSLSRGRKRRRCTGVRASRLRADRARGPGGTRRSLGPRHRPRLRVVCHHQLDDVRPARSLVASARPRRPVQRGPVRPAGGPQHVAVSRPGAPRPVVRPPSSRAGRRYDRLRRRVGYGYWVRVWHDLGVPRVDGCDLVPAAAERLQAEFGARGDRFVASDIGAPDPGLPAETYDLVSVMNVLLHLTDDDAFRRALGSIASLVAPGGRLILVEPILLNASYERPATETQTSRARALAAYRDPLLAAGLELVEIRGALAMANNPIEAGSRAAYDRYLRWWRWVARRAKSSPQSIRWIGPPMLLLDRLALATGAAPSSKIVLFRRPEGSGGR